MRAVSQRDPPRPQRCPGVRRHAGGVPDPRLQLGHLSHQLRRLWHRRHLRSPGRLYPSQRHAGRQGVGTGALLRPPGRTPTLLRHHICTHGKTHFLFRWELPILLSLVKTYFY